MLYQARRAGKILYNSRAVPTSDASIDGTCGDRGFGNTTIGSGFFKEGKSESAETIQKAPRLILANVQNGAIGWKE
jgi:hypothetical protein